MSERPKENASKAFVGASPPRVQIPPPPPASCRSCTSVRDRRAFGHERAHRRSGPITTVVLDRPEARNAVDGPTAAALAAAFREFDADERKASRCCTARGDVLRRRRPEGAVPSAATASSPTATARGPEPDAPEQAGDRRRRGPRRRGWAGAGDLVRPAGRRADATFGVYCRRWGVPLIDGGTVRLPRLIGRARARPDAHRPPVDADEALRIGLADRVVQTGGSRARAEELARSSPRCPRIACATTGSRCSTTWP